MEKQYYVWPKGNPALEAMRSAINGHDELPYVHRNAKGVKDPSRQKTTCGGREGDVIEWTMVYSDLRCRISVISDSGMEVDCPF